MIPADLPQEVYDRAVAVRTSAIATAERRMLDEAANLARQAQSDRDIRALIRPTPPPPAARGERRPTAAREAVRAAVRSARGDTA